ncbi:MAG: pyridoxamine 5'-phosphate oxidase family protein [Bacteroidales bacterium]|uniref:pyridoxamine 5'-phosphate oxidase family protein n=1 Tax=Porphyromonas sp. TaxID=1924944 RepID=UPI0029765AF4|nr:pyridoxamine 5'-phosphate oxidase family protein [Porphyromonas sp.]MDD7438856.1 pyridoxamine 5'-phosphate oxidase family protein [Bacteroidales bacterium]MDY3067310.1 pyridoxamine 5'-phosphate oxidase family protein [Porphyromonas sp.]
MMRRKDREMPSEWGKQVIDKAQFGVVSVVTQEGLPYTLPLSIVRDGDTLYFHSARDGRKVEVYCDGMPVQAVFVGDVKVPELYSAEELEEMRGDNARALELTHRVFTTEYESAIVQGRIFEVTTDQEREHAFRLICQKFTPDKMALFSSAYKSGGSKTRVYAINIDTITAKRKRYDSSGEEMKFGRLE